MRGFVVTAVLITLVLAGCTEKSNSTSSSSAAAGGASTAALAGASSGTTTKAASGSTGTGTGASTGAASSGTTTAGPNGPPTATLTSANLTGSIPLNVTFAVGGSDPDGDELTYNLTFGDGSASVTGTTLPANVTHSYTLVGNFTVTLVVSDATHAANATLLVQATAAAAATGIAPGHDPNCQRPDAQSVPGGYWLDARGDDPVTAYTDGGGDWVYKESNGIAGLQVSQVPGSIQHQAGDDSDVDPIAVQFECLNGDTLEL